MAACASMVRFEILFVTFAASTLYGKVDWFYVDEREQRICDERAAQLSPASDKRRNWEAEPASCWECWQMSAATATASLNESSVSLST